MSDTHNNTNTAVNFSAMKAAYEQEHESIEQAESTTRMLGGVMLFVVVCGLVSVVAAIMIAVVK